MFDLRTTELNVSSTYYEATATGRHPFPALAGVIDADVCVVGGGVAGCSAALELASRGYRVVLLEAAKIGSGASGRSGGQIIPGYACDQGVLVQLLGRSDAKRLWDLSVQAVGLLLERIDHLAIQCDWRPGHLQVAIKPRQRDSLLRWHHELTNHYNYPGTRIFDRDALAAVIGSNRYRFGLLDPNGGHLHPLNYTLGLAHGAQHAGALLFENSLVISIAAGAKPKVSTSSGTINASFVVVCANAYVAGLLDQIAGRIIPVATYMIATERLGEERARELIRDNSAVMDTNFILDYFRLSVDWRLLFGGRVSYSGHDAFDSRNATRKRMLKVFPQLDHVAIDFAWNGLLDITMNRAPDFGRIGTNIYYLQGFSGHGLALAGMAGKLAAEAIAGQAERFDLFVKIKHRDFPGGSHLRMPALVLAMLWYRLRDLL